MCIKPLRPGFPKRLHEGCLILRYVGFFLDVIRQLLSLTRDENEAGEIGTQRHKRIPPFASDIVRAIEHR